MIEKMNHYSFTTPASIHDEEALTALELMGRMGVKMNEVIQSQNDLKKHTYEALEDMNDYLTEEVRKQVENTIPAEVSDEFKERLENGTFTDAIGVYLGNLSERLNMLARAVANDEVSSGTDAEVIDIRTTLMGFDMGNAGASVRKLEEYIQTLFNENMAVDVTKLIGWNRGKAISKTGKINTVENGKWAVGSVTLKKGDFVDFELFGTPNTCVVAIGSPTEPTSGVVAGDTEGLKVMGTYRVKDEMETVYFMTDMTEINQSSVYIGRAIPFVNEWATGYYINDSGVLTEEPARLHGVLWQPIEIPANSMLTADLQCSPSVQAITLCDGATTNAHNLPARVLGKNGNVRETYTYINATPEPVYVRLCSRVNKVWDDETIETTFFNDTNIQIKPLEKYRVPTFTIGNGHISVTDSDVKNDGVYKYSDMIMLFPNETIRYPSAGSDGAWLLSEWDGYNRTFTQGLVKGDSRFRWVEYTNTDTYPMFVRICAKVVSSGATDNAIRGDEFTNVKIYVKDVYYSDVKNHPLYGKKLALFGDSLLYGNNSGNDTTWWAMLAHKYNMTTDFYGGNGFPIYNTSEYTSIKKSVLNYTGDADYCVVMGGANDYRLNISLNDFASGVESIINTIRSKSPKTKIQVLTNMRRFPNVQNSAYATEKDYVDKMVTTCCNLCVAHFNNYTQLGVDLSSDVFKWADEGSVKELQFDATAEGTMNQHLSREGYEWVMSVYENLLMGL